MYETLIEEREELNSHAIKIMEKEDFYRGIWQGKIKQLDAIIAMIEGDTIADAKKRFSARVESTNLYENDTGVF